MAPKGGKGGGGGGGRGGSGRGSTSRFTKQCRANNAFGEPALIAGLAFMVIAALFYLCIACCIQYKRNKGKQRGHRKARSLWWALVLSIILMLVSTGFFIALTIMQQCGVNPGSYSTMTLIKEWLWNWSVLLLIGVIMVPLCKQLHELAGRIMAKLVAVLHLGVMCLLALLLMVYLGLASAIPNMDSTSRRTRQNLNRVAIWAYVAYNAVAVIGTGAAGASILIALIRSAFIRRSPSKKWIIILIPSSVLMMLTELAFQINFAIRRQSYTPPAWAAYIFLSNIFIILAMMAVVSLATDPSTVGPATTNQQNHPTSTSYSYTPVAGQGFNPYDGVKTEYSSASQPAAQPYQPVPGNTNHHPGAEVRNPLLQRPGNEPTPAPAYSHQNPNYYQ